MSLILAVRHHLCLCVHGPCFALCFCSAEACRAPVLCPTTDAAIGLTCSLPDGSEGVLCVPAPAADASPARRLAGRRAALLVPSGRSDGAAARRHAQLHMEALSELEDRLEAVLHRPGTEEADLTGLRTAAGGDPAEAQELGRIGLQRLLATQAIGNETTL